MNVSAIIAEGYVRGDTEASRRKWATKLLRGRWPVGLGVSGGMSRRRGNWLPLARQLLVRRHGLLCASCGREPQPLELQDWQADGIWPLWLHVDHVIALADDGDHHIDNMRLLCKRCNSAAWVNRRTAA